MALGHRPLNDGPALRVAVIGPTNIQRVGAAAGIAPHVYIDAAYEVGRQLAAGGHTLIVVPDRGVAVAAMEAYLDEKGRHLVGICPSSGVSEPAAVLGISKWRDRCHEVVADCSWYEQHHRIGVLSDRMVCVGLSCGTVAELAWTKWTPGPSVALVRSTMSGLPPELMAEVSAELVELEDVADWLVS